MWPTSSSEVHTETFAILAMDTSALFNIMSCIKRKWGLEWESGVNGVWCVWWGWVGLGKRCWVRGCTILNVLTTSWAAWGEWRSDVDGVWCVWGGWLGLGERCSLRECENSNVCSYCLQHMFLDGSVQPDQKDVPQNENNCDTPRAGEYPHHLVRLQRGFLALMHTMLWGVISK